MHFRLIRPGDFATCVALLPPAFRIPVRLRDALPALWGRLLSTGQLNGGVVLDAAGSGGQSIVAYGITAFVNDAFIDEHAASPRPYLSAIVYERLLSGRSPLLDLKEVARANSAASLNLLILHFGISGPAPDHPRSLMAVAAAHDGFRLTHVGYRIRRVVQEGYGPQQLAFLTAGGFLLKTDYAGYYEQASVPKPLPEEWPYLVVLDREDPESRLPGTTLSALFQAPLPRFHFSPAEQRVLVRAVMDEGDEEVAQALGVSDDAVKKIWRRIYERVAAVDADLLGRMSDRSGLTRGKEKRRRLVRHLRYHLEELRPFAAGTRRARGSPHSARERARYPPPE